MTQTPSKKIPDPRGLVSPREKVRPLKLVSHINEGARPTVAERDDGSDEFLRTIVDTCPSDVAVLDEAGTILYASKAWQSFWKYNGLATDFGDDGAYFEACTRLADQTLPEQANATLSDDIRQLRVGTETEFHRRYCYHGLTRPVHFAVHAARLNLPEAGFRILITHEDVMPSRDALRRSEKSLSQLLEKTKIVVWEAEAESCRFTYVSEQASSMFGYSLSQWYEPDFLASHIHRDDRDRALSFFVKQSQIAKQYDFTFRVLAKNGRVVWVHNLVSVTHENGRAKSLRGFMIDITERKRAEEALRDLGGRLITAQEEERSRIARELHDDLNQRMALLSIELEQLGQEARKPHSLRRRFQALQKKAQEISTDLHRLSYELHPSKLDHLGLGAAVKSLCEEMSRNQKLKIEVRQKGFPATLPGDVTLCVFRIVQEALRNCLRHSGAQAVQVVMEKKASAVCLSVSDNGCGFDTESSLMKKGLGFISMRERIRLVGGEIHVYSQPERGTRIELSVPLRRQGSESVAD